MTAPLEASRPAAPDAEDEARYDETLRAIVDGFNHYAQAGIAERRGSRIRVSADVAEAELKHLARRRGRR